MWGHSGDLWVSCTNTIFRVGGLYWSLSQAELWTGCSCLSAQMDKARRWHNSKEGHDDPSWNSTCSPPLGTLINDSYSAFFTNDPLMTRKPPSFCLSSPFLLDTHNWYTRAQALSFWKGNCMALILWLSQKWKDGIHRGQHAARNGKKQSGDFLFNFCSIALSIQIMGNWNPYPLHCPQP